MQELYNCFEKSGSLSEFKARVFKNRIECRFSYAGPLKELLVASFDRSGMADLICDIFSHNGAQQVRAALEDEMELYYAETLAEYYPRFDLYLESL
jgi:hypothetical protein